MAKEACGSTDYHYYIQSCRETCESIGCIQSCKACEWPRRFVSLCIIYSRASRLEIGQGGL